MASSKFAPQDRLKPVYRRRRFDRREALLSGPAWAGLLAIISARRNALKAWLGESVIRTVVVGALATGLGIQASTTPSVAKTAAGRQVASSRPAEAKAPQAGGALSAGAMHASDSHLAGQNKTESDLAVVELASRAHSAGQAWSAMHALTDASAGWGDRADGFGAAPSLDLAGAGVGDLTSGSSGPSGHHGGGTGSASNGPDGATGSQTGPYLTPPVGQDGSGPVAIAGGGVPYVTPWQAPVAQTSPVPGPVGVTPNVINAGLGGEPLGGVVAPGETIPESGSPGGVPEPAAWATMFLGVALLGAAVRGRRTSPVASAPQGDLSI